MNKFRLLKENEIDVRVSQIASNWLTLLLYKDARVDMDILDVYAKKYNTTRAKLCIRYCIEKNTLPLPKSVHEQRIIDNLDVDFKISNDDMEYLDSLYHIASTRPFRS
jgi:diketogulonate reductase-like aldo/keto reductase